MVIIGVILLIVGVVLLLAPIPYPNTDAVGWLLILVGIVLLLIGLLLGSDIDLGDDHSGLKARSSWGATFGPLGFLWQYLHERRVLRRPVRMHPRS